MEVEFQPDSSMLESNLPVVDVGPDRPEPEAPSEMNETDMDIFDKYKKVSDEYWEKTEELNANLAKEDQFFPVYIQPRCPEPASSFPYYRLYSMSDTSQTSLRSKRFTQRGTYDYPALTMLQIFSVKCVGNVLVDKSIYGFIAIRDELDGLRNYVFNRSREQPHKVKRDSLTLPLISPLRGNSFLDGVLLEYNLKVKCDDSDSSQKDLEIIDGCIEFTPETILRGATLKSRLFGTHGLVDMHYAFLKNGIEATVDVAICKAEPGWSLKRIAAFTSGHPDEITIYDGSNISVPSPNCPISSVMAVQLGYELVLRFDIVFNDIVHMRHMRRKSPRISNSDILVDEELKPKTYSRSLKYTSEKYSCETGKVTIDDNFQADVTVTWSTMGPY